MEAHHLLFFIGAIIYVLGLVVMSIQVYSRDYDDTNGPLWLLRACRTEACCICFEPIANVLSIVLWPIVLLYLAVYFASDKSMHATTCCGRTLRKTRERKRLESVNTNSIYGVFNDIELGSDGRSTMSWPGGPTPPPRYLSQANSLHNPYTYAIPRPRASSMGNASPHPGRSNSSAQELRKMIFNRNIDEANSLSRWSSESKLSSLREVADATTADVGPRISRANSADKAEHLRHSRSSPIARRPIHNPVDGLSIPIHGRTPNATP